MDKYLLTKEKKKRNVNWINSILRIVKQRGTTITGHTLKAQSYFLTYDIIINIKPLKGL